METRARGQSQRRKLFPPNLKSEHFSHLKFALRGHKLLAPLYDSQLEPAALLLKPDSYLPFVLQIALNVRVNRSLDQPPAT